MPIVHVGAALTSINHDNSCRGSGKFLLDSTIVICSQFFRGMSFAITW